MKYTVIIIILLIIIPVTTATVKIGTTPEIKGVIIKKPTTPTTTTNASFNQSLADSIYLKLDTSNDPISNQLSFENSNNYIEHTGTEFVINTAGTDDIKLSASNGDIVLSSSNGGTLIDTDTVTVGQGAGTSLIQTTYDASTNDGVFWWSNSNDWFNYLDIVKFDEQVRIQDSGVDYDLHVFGDTNLTLGHQCPADQVLYGDGSCGFAGNGTICGLLDVNCVPNGVESIQPNSVLTYDTNTGNFTTGGSVFLNGTDNLLTPNITFGQGAFPFSEVYGVIRQSETQDNDLEIYSGDTGDGDLWLSINSQLELFNRGDYFGDITSMNWKHKTGGLNNASITYNHTGNEWTFSPALPSSTLPDCNTNTTNYTCDNDINNFTADQNVFGILTVSAGNGKIVSTNGAGALIIQNQNGNAGAISFSNTADIGIPSNENPTSENWDPDGTMIFKQKGSNPVSNAEFVFLEEAGSWRFAMPKSQAGLGTSHPRSMIIAGPSLDNETNFECGYWSNHLNCDTTNEGADLYINNNVEIGNRTYLTEIRKTNDLDTYMIGSETDTWDFYAGGKEFLRMKFDSLGVTKAYIVNRLNADLDYVVNSQVSNNTQYIDNNGWVSFMGDTKHLESDVTVNGNLSADVYYGELSCTQFDARRTADGYVIYGQATTSGTLGVVFSDDQWVDHVKYVTDLSASADWNVTLRGGGVNIGLSHLFTGDEAVTDTYLKGEYNLTAGTTYTFYTDEQSGTATLSIGIDLCTRRRAK